MPDGQHPGDPLVVQLGFDRDEDTDDDDHQHRCYRADGRADRAGQPPHAAHDLLREALNSGTSGSHQVPLDRILHQALPLQADDVAQFIGLGGQGRSGEVEDPTDEAEAGQGDDS